MRRANGMGSVYKLKGSHRKPYIGAVTIGWNDAERKRIRKTKAFATQPEAQEFIAQYANDPVALEAKEITLRNILDKVIEQKKKEIAPQSMSKYYTAKSMHLTALMDYPIADIKTMHIQAIIDKMPKQSQKESMKIVMNQCYEYAMANDICMKNYATYIKTPQREKSEKHQPFTLEELQKLWKLAPNNWDARLMLVYIYTGMRPSELLIVKMSDVHDRYLIGGMKTDAGKTRTIPIADCIKPYITMLMTESLSYGIKTLVPNPKTKGALTRNTYRMAFKDTCISLGVSGHIPHDTRHTFGTLSDNIGMNVKIKKMIMGHSTKKDITMEVYTHKTTQQLIDAVNKLPHGVNMNYGEMDSQTRSHDEATATKTSKNA